VKPQENRKTKKTKEKMSKAADPTYQVDAASALSFPAPLFRHISPSLYLQRHLVNDPPIRPSGRALDQHRPFTLTTSSLSHAHGSAVVRTGDTAVVCGVRGEILSLAPGDDTKGYESYGNNLSMSTATGSTGSGGIGGAGWGGLIVPNIELSTGCSKHYPLGPPSDVAQALAQRLFDLINITKVVDLTSLRIYDNNNNDTSGVPGDEQQGIIKGYWTLYIDVLCISLDGNLLDAAWMAIIAALNSTKLPQARYDTDEERIVCSPVLEQYHKLSLRKSLPIVATYIIVSVPIKSDDDENYSSVSRGMKTLYLSDPDTFEEMEVQDFVSMVVSVKNETGHDHDISMDGTGDNLVIERIEKTQGGEIDLQEFGRCVQLSGVRLRQFLQVLNQK